MMKRVHLSNTKKLFDFPDHFTPSTVEIPWAIEAKRVRRGEGSPIDGFDRKIEEGVGKH